MIGQAPPGFAEVESRTLSPEVRKEALAITTSSPKGIFWISTEDGSDVITRLVQGRIRYYRKNKCKKVRIPAKGKILSRQPYRWKHSELRKFLTPMPGKLTAFSCDADAESGDHIIKHYSLTPFGIKLLEEARRRSESPVSSPQKDRIPKYADELADHAAIECPQDTSCSGEDGRDSSADHGNQSNAHSRIIPYPGTLKTNEHVPGLSMSDINYLVVGSPAICRPAAANELIGTYDRTIRDPLLMVAEDVFIRLLIWPDRWGLPTLRPPPLW